MKELEAAIQKQIRMLILTSVIISMVIVPAWHYMIRPLNGWFDILTLALIALGLLTAIRLRKPLSLWYAVHEPLSPDQKNVLLEKVEFYRTLTPDEQTLFDAKIQYFLHEVYIKAIDTALKPEDPILIAASAVIPVFRFPHWEYHLDTVLVYPKGFNEDFETRSDDDNIQGMVLLKNVMILSQNALESGFSNKIDRHNVGIHEFAHKIDQADNSIDGIPSLLLDRPSLRKLWWETVEQEMDAIKSGESDIDPYGGTSPVEFFAVATEYFFERPVLMSEQHPELYDLLRQIYKQDLKSVLTRDFRQKFRRSKLSLGRNSPCPCGSGKKYKHCCLNK